MRSVVGMSPEDKFWLFRFSTVGRGRIGVDKQK